MKTTKTITTRQHKHTKRQDRLNHRLNVGTPQVFFRKQHHVQKQELLSDWEDAS